MDKKLRETTKLCEEITNRKWQVMKGEIWSRGTNSRLQYDLCKRNAYPLQ